VPYPIVRKMVGDRLVIEFNVTEKQRQFLSMGNRYRLFLGGVGSGKTTAGCLEVIRVALFYPGTQVLMLRRTAREMEKTVLPVFEDLLRMLDGDDGSGYKFLVSANRDEQCYVIRSLYRRGVFSESYVYWSGADNPDKLQGMNLGGVFIDEAREISEEFWNVLISRLRNPAGPRRAWLSSLPPPSGHWIERLFLRGEGGEDYGYVHATTFDNPNLPADYVQSLMNYDEFSYRELVLGEQVPSRYGGAVFTSFSRRHHIVDKSVLEELKKVYGGKLHVYRGIDFGYHFPAAVWLTLDGNGRVVVLREFLGSKMTFPEFLAKLKAIDNEEGWVVLRDFHDPHAAYTTDIIRIDRAEMMREAGFNPVAASCNFEDGIHMIERLLTTLVFGEPMLRVMDRCRLLILGFEGEYCFDERGKGVKDSVVVHLMDALRYAIMGLWGRLTSLMDVVPRSRSSRFEGFSYSEDFVR